MRLTCGRGRGGVGSTQNQIRRGFFYHLEHVSYRRCVTPHGLSWDCVVSCEMIGTYKTQPQAYRTCAQWLGYRPDELLMVASHNFDLMAARAEGYLSAFVHRPAEWGPAGPPDPVPKPSHDIIARDFGD